MDQILSTGYLIRARKGQTGHYTFDVRLVTLAVTRGRLRYVIDISIPIFVMLFQVVDSSLYFFGMWDVISFR